MFLVYDGHGSTRALLDHVAQIVQNAAAGNQQQLFSYDAYGNLIVAPGLVQQVAQALTTLLYSGEHTDAATGLQYLRARYYSSLTGTFNRVDPFAGYENDPQSLHKYLYTHGDPVNGIDPSGEFLVSGTLVLVQVKWNFCVDTWPADWDSKRRCDSVTCPGNQKSRISRFLRPEEKNAESNRPISQVLNSEFWPLLRLYPLLAA
jgi:RHS repeat-associated protein